MAIRFLAMCAILSFGCGGKQRCDDCNDAANRATELAEAAETAETGVEAGLSSRPQVVSAAVGLVPISIRLAGELTDELRAELDALGMQWNMQGGELLHLGPIYSGSAPAENTAAMQALDGVIRVEQSGRAPVVLPQTNQLVRPAWECDPARALPPAASCGGQELGTPTEGDQ